METPAVVPLMDQLNEYVRPKHERARKRRFGGELEARFERERAPSRNRRVLANGLRSLLIFDVLLFSDYLLEPSGILRDVAIRVGIVTPLVLGIFWLIGRGLPTWLRESLVVLGCCLVAISVLLINFHVSTLLSVFALPGFLLVMMFGLMALRPRFPYAVATVAIFMAMDVVFVSTDPWMSVGAGIKSISLVAGCSLLSLMTCWATEMDERISYALFLREELNREGLFRRNEALTSLSNRDALTGMANRRFFDRSFAEAWAHACSVCEPLSLLMIDIDQFKQLNDRCGHLMGDQVLVTLASVFPEAIRENIDLAARFGGDEFVILLPGVDVREAHRVGERIRRMVETSPQIQQECARDIHISISCGTATMVPTELDSPTDLILKADKALYDAKSQGKNRVYSQVDLATLDLASLETDYQL